MEEQGELWTAVAEHLCKNQPKNGALWKQAEGSRKECSYCELPAGGAVVCCHNASCRVRAHLPCAVGAGSLKLEDDGTLVFLCEKHTEPILFCVCKNPYDANYNMIACDTCDDWFHNTCVGLDAMKEYEHFECEECKVLRKRLSKPDQQDALAKEIKRKKTVNQAKDDLNTAREQTFLGVDPFTETMNDKIAPIMKEIRVEDYKFHDTELSMDEVKTARNRMEREIMSASPGKVDNGPLPEDANILQRMRRMPLLFKWKEELTIVITAFESWRKEAESAITIMSGELNETVGYSHAHCEKLRKFDAMLKPLGKRLETLRCAETDAAWFESVMASMAWVTELYIVCYEDSQAAGATGSSLIEVDEGILAKFQSTLKKFKNVRNALQASVVQDGSIWFPFFTSFLDSHGNVAKQIDDYMGEWDRRARKSLIAPAGESPLGALEALQQEARRSFPFRTTRVHELNAAVTEARTLEQETDAFLSAYASDDRKLEYSESRGITGLDVDALSDLHGRVCDSQVRIPSHEKLELAVSYVEMLNEWTKIQSNGNGGAGGAGSEGRHQVRLDMSNLREILEVSSSNTLADGANAQSPLSAVLRAHHDSVVGKVKHALEAAAPSIKKARKQLETVTLDDITGLHDAYLELQNCAVESEEEHVLVAVIRASALGKEVKALLSRARPLTDLTDICGLASAESRGSLISADAFKKLQIDMNKVLKGAPREYLEGCLQPQGGNVDVIDETAADQDSASEAQAPHVWIKSTIALLDGFKELSNDIANELNDAMIKWGRVEESLRRSSAISVGESDRGTMPDETFLSKESLLDYLNEAYRTGIIYDDVATKATTAGATARGSETEFSSRLSTFTAKSLEASPAIDATLVSLTQIYEQCKVLPIAQSLYDTIKRHLGIVRCLKVTLELDRTARDDGISDGLNITEYASLIVPRTSNAEVKGRIAGLSGVPLALALYRVLKQSLDEIVAAFTSLSADTALSYAVDSVLDPSTKPTSLQRRFYRHWWITEAQALVVSVSASTTAGNAVRGDKADAMSLVQVSADIGVDNTELYHTLQGALATMTTFENEAREHLTKIHEAVRTTNALLNESATASQRLGGDDDAARFQLFVAVIGAWGKCVGTSGQEIERCLQLLRNRSGSSSSRSLPKAPPLASSESSQETVSSQDAMDVEGDVDSNPCGPLGNRQLEQDLYYAHRLADSVRRGSDTCIEIMKVVGGGGGVDRNRDDVDSRLPRYQQLQVAVTKSQCVQLHHLGNFLLQLKALDSQIRRGTSAGAAPSTRSDSIPTTMDVAEPASNTSQNTPPPSTPATAESLTYPLVAAQCMTFLIQLLDEYHAQATAWVEQAQGLVPAASTRQKAKALKTNKAVKARDIEAALELPIARAIVTPVHETILTALSEYEHFFDSLKKRILSPAYYLSQRGGAGEADATSAFCDFDDGDDNTGTSESQESQGVEEDGEFSSTEARRQRKLLERQQRTQNLIDRGKQLPLDVSDEIDTLKWVISVIKWDREMGAESVYQKAARAEDKGLYTFTLEAAQQRAKKAKGVLYNLPYHLVDMLTSLGAMQLVERGDVGLKDEGLPTGAEFILPHIHHSFAATVNQLNGIESAIQGVSNSGLITFIKGQIDTISSRKLSHTSADFLSIHGKLKDHQERVHDAGTVDINIPLSGEGSTAEGRETEHSFKIRVGLPLKLGRQVAFVLSGQYRGKVKSLPVGSSGGGQKLKGVSSGSMPREAGDSSSEATDSGSDSSSDEDGGADAIEAAELVARRGRPAGARGGSGKVGKQPVTGGTGVRSVQNKREATAAAAADRERARMLSEKRASRPPCSGILCKARKSPYQAQQNSRYCGWACAADAAARLYNSMITQKSLLTQACSFAGKDGTSTNGILDTLSGIDMSKKCVNSTTAADRQAFNPPAFDGSAVVEAADDLCKTILSKDGWLDASGASVDIDCYGNEIPVLPADGFVATALDNLRSSKSTGSTGNSQMKDAPSGYHYLPSLPPAARAVITPTFNAKMQDAYMEETPLLILGNQGGAKKAKKLNKEGDAVSRSQQTKERELRIQYRLKLEASLSIALQRLKRINVGGLAAALALELENELNYTYLEPFDHDEVPASAQARAKLATTRKAMLKAYAEQYKLLLRALKEPHNDEKVQQLMDGTLDAEDICTMKPADFESADDLAAKERIRAAALQGALRKEDQSANSEHKDVLTAVSESEIAASARRKLEQDQEELERRRRKSQENKKARAGGIDASQEYADMDVETPLGGDGVGQGGVADGDPSNTSRKRGRHDIDAGTRYAKQLKPSGVTVVDYTPGGESKIIREGVGHVKTESDPTPARHAGGDAGRGSPLAASRENSASPSPKNAGKHVKKGKGILGLLKKAPVVGTGDGSGGSDAASAALDIEAATTTQETKVTDALYVVSSKGNASLEIMRSGAAWIKCFGMIANKEREAQGVLHDKLVMIGRVRFHDLNKFIDSYKRQKSKKVAIMVITVGGDVSFDSAFGNMVRELSEPGKERAGLFYGEGIKDSKETNYELYIVPPSLKSKLTELHSRQDDLDDLIFASGPQCTVSNTFYGVVTYTDGGPDRYVNASEVVLQHARNASHAVLASITHEVVFDPEEASTAGSTTASASDTESEFNQESSAESPCAAGAGSSTSAPTTGGAYSSIAASFSASYAAGNADLHESLPVVVPHVPQGLSVGQSANGDEEVVFEPAPADGDVTYPGSPQAAATDADDKAGALAMSSEMRELLSKAADHCARSGVKTFKQMQAREQKQRVRTMPFLFPEHPGHELFKAEVIRREKEIKANKSRR